MIERIARSIYERRNGHGCRAWGSLEKAHREPYLGDARAAMGALYEPTERMLDAARNDGFWEKPDDKPSAYYDWKAMIAEAMKG